MVLRIADPKGNRQKGKFHRADDLRNRFRRQIAEFQKAELDMLFASKERSDRFKREVIAEGREPGLKPYAKKGFRIRFDYKGKRYVAGVRRGGKINYKGKLFTSPSLAAAAITRHPMSGWRCWKYQRSPGEWALIDELRK